MSKSSENPKFQEQRVEGADQVNSLISKQVDTAAVLRARTLGEHLTEDIKLAASKKADEIQKTLERSRDILGEKLMLTLQKELQAGIAQRLEVILNLTAGKENAGVNDTPDELFKIRTQGIFILQNTDVIGLTLTWLKNNHHEDLAKKLEERGEKELVKDTFPVLNKIRMGEDLGDPEWKVVDEYAHALMNGIAPGPQKTTALAMLGWLSVGDRRVLLGRLVAEPKLPDLIEELVRRSYLTTDQALDFLEDKKGKVWEALKVRITAPAMQKAQERWEETKKRTVHELTHRNFGDRNSTREMFNFKDMFLFGMAINGAAGVLINLAVDRADPFELINNPGFLISTAQLVAGLQGTEGFKGMAPVPFNALAKVLEKQADVVNARNKTQQDDLNRLLGNNPAPAKFYYTLVGPITNLYHKKIEDPKNGNHPHLTLQELGIDPEKLPQEYRDFGVQRLEDSISEFAFTFAYKFGLKDRGEDPAHHSHANEMQKAAKIRRVPAYEIDRELEKATLKPSK